MLVKPTKIMGIDPSTFTGLCLLEGDVCSTKIINFPDAKGFQRLHLIAKSVRNVAEEWHPSFAVIEGYAYGNVNTLVTLVEIGTLIRKTLHDLKIPWYDAPPSVLKKFVSGAGTTNKAGMASATKTRWGFESKSDDVVDAYGLARMGQAILNQDKFVLKGVKYHAHDKQ